MVDTRPKGRYDGTAPEPNPKIRSGHMHGSISFPFTNIIDPETKTMKNVDAIKQGVWLQLDGGGYGQSYCHVVPVHQEEQVSLLVFTALVTT